MYRGIGIWYRYRHMPTKLSRNAIIYRTIVFNLNLQGILYMRKTHLTKQIPYSIISKRPQKLVPIGFTTIIF